MSILKNFIRQIKMLFKKEEDIIYVAPCGTVVEELPFTIEVPEGKEVAKFNPNTGKLYWPSDGYEANGPGIRDILIIRTKMKLKNKKSDYLSGSHPFDDENKLIISWL